MNPKPPSFQSKQYSHSFTTRPISSSGSQANPRHAGRRSVPRLDNLVDDILNEMEAVDVVLHAHVERRSDRVLLLVASDMEVPVGSPIRVSPCCFLESPRKRCVGIAGLSVSARFATFGLPRVGLGRRDGDAKPETIGILSTDFERADVLDRLEWSPAAPSPARGHPLCSQFSYSCRRCDRPRNHTGPSTVEGSLGNYLRRVSPLTWKRRWNEGVGILFMRAPGRRFPIAAADDLWAWLRLSKDQGCCTPAASPNPS